MSRLLDAAIRYINYGLAPIPVWPDAKKNPHLNQIGQYFGRLPTCQEWQRWSRLWPNANIALITGYWRNLVCLDFDNDLAFDTWAGDNSSLSTWTVKTARGYHVWLQTRSEPGKSRIYKKNGLGVLLRAKGGYVIAPPSVHWSGQPYKTLINVLPRVIDDPEEILPGWEIKFEAEGIPQSSRDLFVLPTRVKMEEMIPPVAEHPNCRGAYLARCPFHDDQKPSAWINIEDQRFGCNACWPGLWWDVINVYGMLRQVSNGEAFKLLKRM